MNRSIAMAAMASSLLLTLTFAAAPAGAGEAEDCYNDKVDADSRYTRAAPEELQVTEADIEKMLADIRAHELRASMLARAGAGETASQTTSD